MSLEIYGNGLVKVAGVDSAHFGAGPFMENPTEVTADYTLADNTNAMSAGPITIGANVTVTIGQGSEWTVV